MLGLIALPFLAIGLPGFGVFDGDDDDSTDIFTPDELVDADEPVDPDASATVGNLVTVTADDGTEVTDDSVISSGRSVNGLAVDIVVRPPDGPNNILVG
jgi:hypothetical protein